MSPERAEAYRRVIQTLADLGPAKLLAGEQDQIRYAADSLIFSANLLKDASTLAALAEAENLCRALVDSGRWEPATASRLVDDLHGCGPERPVVLNAA